MFNQNTQCILIKNILNQGGKKKKNLYCHMDCASTPVLAEEP